MVTNERETRQKKVAAALLLLQQQEAALINEFIPSAIPNTDLIIIKREHYDVFMRTVNYAVEHHQTKHFLGIEKQHFDILLQHCRKKQRQIPISEAARLFVFLKYSREGRSQSYLAKDVGISQATISRIINNTIDDLIAVADLYIKFPSTIEHSCTSNGDVQKVEVMSEDPRESKTPAFVAWNLGTNDHAAAYEKLLVPYMKEECWKYDCRQVRKQIQDSCNKKKYLNIRKQCHDGLGRALRIYCNSDGGDNRDTICTEYVTSTTKTTSTSTTESSNLVPIIIGASVATIVLIGGLICFLKCRQGKKNKVLDPYGKTNGLSWHTLCVSHDLYLSAISLHRVSTRGTCIVNSDEERGRDTPPDVILFTSSALADSERSCYLAPLTLNKR
ncbi:hypothetical protein L3Y34_009790 [Caenorhabditis briggsae]|uniref:HTH cro/C1-type domain-containing protein n=1 Tax=Caenorhabditis briggsae TaxID=6238 RepID=A0AAE9D2U6_CAEBR|nr:hypothetical protein L3Y34_009790 [Caenorhabditis briggsae]